MKPLPCPHPGARVAEGRRSLAESLGMVIGPRSQDIRRLGIDHHLQLAHGHELRTDGDVR